jgi:hypothetical protein
MRRIKIFKGFLKRASHQWIVEKKDMEEISIDVSSFWCCAITNTSVELAQTLSVTCIC